MTSKKNDEKLIPIELFLGRKKNGREDKRTEVMPIKNCDYKPKISRDGYDSRKEYHEILQSLSCPEVWQKLDKTDEDNVRFCDKCERTVHLVTNDEELGKSIRLNQCIAWQLPADIREKYENLSFVMGQPELSFGPVTRKLMFGK